MPATVEIGRGKIRRRERHRGCEAGAHGALGVGRDEGKTARIGQGGGLEPADVNPGRFEPAAVDVREFVIAELAEKGRVQAEARRIERGVGRRTAGGAGGRAVQQ